MNFPTLGLAVALASFAGAEAQPLAAPLAQPATETPTPAGGDGADGRGQDRPWARRLGVQPVLALTPAYSPPSNMPVIRPSDEIDPAMVVVPKPTHDFKMLIVGPAVTSGR